jgi:hypothetical protein
MLCDSKDYIVNTKSINRKGLLILMAQIYLNRKHLSVKILLDWGSEITIIKEVFIRENNLWQSVEDSSPVSIQGVNGNKSISKKFVKVSIAAHKHQEKYIEIKAFVIESEDSNSKPDMILQTDKALKILRELEKCDEKEISTKWGSIKMWEPHTHAQINQTKIQQKRNDNNSCADYYSNTVNRRHDGGYVVCFPFKRDRTLGLSLPSAKARFAHLEKEFATDKKLKDQYTTFINDLILHDHLIRLPGQLQHRVNLPASFLPHYNVFKKTDLKKEKIRVVFDAASKTRNKKNSNNILMSGPVCQNPLGIILINFRLHEYAVTGDIKQMYNQFKVNADDQQYTHILWHDLSGTLAAYQLVEITFGLAPPAFLATRTLTEISKTTDDPNTAYS